MKKLFFLFFILSLLVCLDLSAQTERTMVRGIYADTLKTARKIYIITPDAFVNSRFTVSVKTITGTDTIFVKTYSRDGTQLSSKTLIDLSNGSPASSMIATITAKEFLIYDPVVFKMQLQTVNATAVTLFTVSRK